MTYPTTSILAEEYARVWKEGDQPPNLREFLTRHAQAQPIDRLNVCLTDQRYRWRVGAGTPAENYFEEWPELFADKEFCLALVYGEFAALRALGVAPRFEDFQKRFPELYQMHLRIGGDAIHGAIAGAFAAPEEDFDPSTIDPDAPMTLDDFEIQQEIGGGGMGSVYKARWLSQQRFVAIKILREFGNSPLEAINRFLKEGGLVTRLRHPSIIRVHGLGRTADGGYFLVMDLFEGTNLEAVLWRSPLRVEQAAWIVASVADAIHHAHENGVIHRDLKPSNVLLDNRWTVMVTDFGIAKWFGTMGDSQAGRIVGTPQFMAPEQGDKRWGRVDRRTDVYGLGGLLYTSLTQRPPYVGRTYMDVVKMVVADTELSTPPSQYRPDIPPALEQICMKCLRKRQDERYRTALELARELSAMYPRPVGAN